MYCKAIFFLTTDTTPESDNPLRFRQNLLERILKLTIAIMIRLKTKSYSMI